MKRNSLFITAAFVVAAGALCPAQTLGNYKFYKKKSNWQQTMLACREALPDVIAEQNKQLKSLTFGPWYVTKPMKSQGFTEKFFPEQGVDLQAKDSSGKNLWQLKTDYADGQVIDLDNAGGISSTTYLFRTITASKSGTFQSRFGSNDAIEVWLNGKKIHSNNAERAAWIDQDFIELNFIKGENRLMLKIYNQISRCGFYFSLVPNPALEFSKCIEQDFPLESGWMKQNLSRQECIKWFENTDTAELELKLNSNVFKQIGQVKILYDKLQSLKKQKVGPSDQRWLDLYIEMCIIREKLKQLQPPGPDLDLLQSRIEVIGALYPSNEIWSENFTGQTQSLKMRYNRIRNSLASGQPVSEEKMKLLRSEIKMIQREVVLNGVSTSGPKNLMVLTDDNFEKYYSHFNTMEDEPVVNFIPNEFSWQWLKPRIPLFECPDKKIEEIYYYRWWTFRKQIKYTEDGFVINEFITPTGHAGKHNTISCALGHHIYEGRWLRDNELLNNYIYFWYRTGPGRKIQPNLYWISNWLADAAYNRYKVNHDKQFITGMLDDMIADYRNWESKNRLPDGLFWQYDVADGMEESISGSRVNKNARATISSYMYGHAMAISEIASLAGKKDIADKFKKEAQTIKKLVQDKLWDSKADFFKVRFEDGSLSDARELHGYIPWYFNLPDPGYEKAWTQLLDPKGFKAPFGLTTAEQRHPRFDGNGRDTCDWDGPIWPYATSQTLVALANVIRNYDQKIVTKRDFFDNMVTYAYTHYHKGQPYIGQYLDFDDGNWILAGRANDRHYNHSTFCDLVITGIVGLVPRDDDTIEVSPLVPEDSWPWFCLDGIRYHDRNITIIWDKTGEKYGKGKGLSVFSDGAIVARSDSLERITGKLP